MKKQTFKKTFLLIIILVGLGFLSGLFYPIGYVSKSHFFPNSKLQIDYIQLPIKYVKIQLEGKVLDWIQVDSYTLKEEEIIVRNGKLKILFNKNNDIGFVEWDLENKSVVQSTGAYRYLWSK